MKKLIVVLLALFACTLSYAMTAGELCTQIRHKVRDNQTLSRLSDAQIYAKMNMIQEEMCAKTLALQKRYYITTSTSNSTGREYRMPNDCIKVLRVAYAINSSTTAFKKLIWTSVGGQDKANSQWENSATGEPKEYYKRIDYIGLKPNPSSSYVGTNYLRVDYAVNATAMSATDSVPFNGDYTLYPFHQSIVYGTVAMIEYEKGNTNAYTLMQTIYLDWLKQMTDIAFTEKDRNTDFSLP